MNRMAKIGLAFGVAQLALALPAQAAIIIDDLPFAYPDPSAQLHNTGNQTAPVVTAYTNPGNVFFQFASTPTENLTINGAGHATIDGADGAWSSLTMTPVNPLGYFSAIDFNLNPLGSYSRSNPLLTDITLGLVGGGSFTFSNVAIYNGQTKFLIFGDAGEMFNSINWTAVTNGGEFDDIRQIDIDAGVMTGAVPEPATWAMMLAGFGLMGAGMRRRKAETRVRFAI